MPRQARAALGPGLATSAGRDAGKQIHRLRSPVPTFNQLQQTERSANCSNNWPLPNRHSRLNTDFLPDFLVNRQLNPFTDLERDH